MKNLRSIAPIIFVLIGLGVGFFAGYEYRNYKLKKATKNIVVSGMMKNGVFGSILSTDDKSITVKLPDGSTKIVLFSDSTAYSNTVAAKKTDLKTGDNVVVTGTTNSDGSVTATTIQINPEFGRPQGSPRPQ